MVRRDAAIQKRRPGAAFTLIELLAVIAMVAVLASLMMPALGRAQSMGRSSVCLSNLRQIGVAWHLYLGDHGDRFPDRRDLKRDLIGGYQPWSTWPKSDPRAGWSAVVLGSLLASKPVWQCPGVMSGPIARLDQVRQWGGTDTNRSPEVTYWMWRFDRIDDPVPADNFWGRTVDESLAGWLSSGNPLVVPGVAFRRWSWWWIPISRRRSLRFPSRSAGARRIRDSVTGCSWMVTRTECGIGDSDRADSRGARVCLSW